MDGIIRTITKKEKEINLEVVSSTIGSDYNYAKATLTSVNKSRIGKLQLNTRGFLHNMEVVIIGLMNRNYI